MCVTSVLRNRLCLTLFINGSSMLYHLVVMQVPISLSLGAYALLLWREVTIISVSRTVYAVVRLIALHSMVERATLRVANIWKKNRWQMRGINSDETNVSACNVSTNSYRSKKVVRALYGTSSLGGGGGVQEGSWNALLQSDGVKIVSVDMVLL